MPAPSLRPRPAMRGADRFTAAHLGRSRRGYRSNTLDHAVCIRKKGVAILVRLGVGPDENSLEAG